MRCSFSLVLVVITLALAVGRLDAQVAGKPRAPTMGEAIASGRDLFGELAIQQTDGPSYEFFEPLVAPLRYVHADFRHYPLVLSGPQALTKARLISNGSGVNLSGGSRSWKPVGTPVVFRVGVDEYRFGELRERVSEPKLAEGWLPIYTIDYRHPSPASPTTLIAIDQPAQERQSEVYRLEAFVSTAPELAEQAVVFVRFSLAAGAKGIITAQLDPPQGSQFARGVIRDGNGQGVVYVDKNWKWERGGVHANLREGTTATLAIATKPLDEGALTCDAATYERHREATAQTWKGIVERAMQVDVAEPRIDAAWRNLLVQNFMLARGERMLYSAGNQYEALYEMEGSDAVLALLAWNYAAEAQRMFVPLLDFSRKGLENHQAGQKLADVSRYWWLTRDDAWVRAMAPRIRREVERLLTNRDVDGLLPKERYCGDIQTPVHSLSVEAKAWRALYDIAPVLEAAGEAALGAKARQGADGLQPKLMAAVAKSIRHETSPPFVPIALLDNESVHDPITLTRIGSYWNLIISYVISSRIFPPGSSEETWIPKYLETHGGLFMGMTRAGGYEHGFWNGRDRVNPLYGTRYVLDALRRDDPDRALVSLYGMLAQGFTRNTLIAGEGSTLAEVDAGGRFFYCPPNSAGNAHFLSILRNLLVQDLDADDDGQPETLRLLFGTSRRWLADGERLTVRNSPTAFGPVSVEAEAKLSDGHVVMRVQLPERDLPRHAFLRARLPDAWRTTGVTIDGKAGELDDRGTADLSGKRGEVVVEFAVAKK